MAEIENIKPPRRRGNFFQATWLDSYWPVRWSFCAAIARTSVPRIAALVPVVGYALLWSDQLKDLLLRFGALGSQILFSPLTRLDLVYYGGLTVMIGMLIYWLFCPSQIKESRSPHEYSQKVASNVDFEEMRLSYERLQPLVSELKTQGDHPDGPLFGKFRAKQLMRGLALNQNADSRQQVVAGQDKIENVMINFAAHYELMDRSWSPLSTLCFVLLVGGVAVFLLPSVEVALLVIRHSFGG